jgi:hypothetical protein
LKIRTFDFIIQPYQFAIEFVRFSKLRNEARGRNNFTNIIFQFWFEIMRRANKNIYIGIKYDLKKRALGKIRLKPLGIIVTI